MMVDLIFESKRFSAHAFAWLPKPKIERDSRDKKTPSCQTSFGITGAWSRTRQMTDFDPLSNRAFLYGEGLFTTLRVDNHKVFFEKEHFLRMKSSLRYWWPKKELNLEEFWPKFWPFQGVTRLTFFETVKERGLLSQGEISVHLTHQDYFPTEKKYALETKASMLFPEGWNNEIKISGHYFFRSFLLRDLNEKMNDVLFFDTRENILGASVGHLFFYENGYWITPSLSPSLLNGIGRKRAINLLSAQEKTITLKDLSRFSRVVHVNSVRGIEMVERIDQFFYDTDFDIINLKQKFFDETN